MGSKSHFAAPRNPGARVCGMGCSVWETLSSAWEPAGLVEYPPAILIGVQDAVAPAGASTSLIASRR